MNIQNNIKFFKRELPPHVQLVAISKTKTVDEIMQAYQAGQRDFGENKVQELVDKQPDLPSDIRWHMVGHLQSNKVKYIAPWVHLVHGVDSEKLLRVINKEGSKNNRVVDCLLQIHIAREDTKFGFSRDELIDMVESKLHENLKSVRICGLMGMATYTEDEGVVKNEFRYLRNLFIELKTSYFASNFYFKELSMGMSGDYKIAIEEGSTIVRIGSLIFGERTY
jgi:PLP dependent protein